MKRILYSMFIFEIFLLLMGFFLIILGVKLLFKDIYKISFLLISLGLIFLGWFWFLALALGILTYFAIIMAGDWEAEGYLKREEKLPNIISPRSNSKNKSRFQIFHWLKR